jgi:4-amino-4-deoxy-L-arabinose transferase-like glycosyltransferase
LKNRQLPFWIFTLATFLALLLPALLKDGMFLDGILNASIARNLSLGMGKFWSLEYSSTLCNPFYDQLPMAMWLQSLFFSIFGDHLFVERLYCLLAAFTTAFFIIKIWRLISRNNSIVASMGWLPVLFWIITPVVFWSYTNNMLDNTMAIFDIAALYLIVKALSTRQLIFPRLALAGALILGAFLSKGPIGLFPLASVFIYGFCYRNFPFTRLLLYSAVLVVVPAVLLGFMLLTMDNALYSFSEYFGQQIMQSLEGKRDLASGRWFIAGRLATELLLMAILTIVIFALSKLLRVKPTTKSGHGRSVIFFLAVALSGSLPIMISLKQSGYYLLPSLPFFAIAASMLIATRLGPLTERIDIHGDGFKFANIFLTLLLCATLVFSFRQTGKISRDTELINDIYIIGGKAPHHTTISVCPDMMQDWGLHAYMMRYYLIKLDCRKPYEFYIADKGCKDEVPEGYTKLPVNTTLYELFQRKK